MILNVFYIFFQQCIILYTVQLYHFTTFLVYKIRQGMLHRQKTKIEQLKIQKQNGKASQKNKRTQQQDTNQENPSEQQQSYITPKKSNPKNKQIDTYEIDHKTLPFIFRFNYAALQRLKMKKAPNIPKIAYEIFSYIQDKIIVKRYSDGGRYPNRMKYEEKVKFLMRAFDHRRNTSSPDPDRRKEKFNRQKQLDFFSRRQVVQHFLEEIQHALVVKKAQNERRVKQIEDYIQMTLSFANIDPVQSEAIFQQRIRRKQLPWTDNMFSDMEEFSKQLYFRFTSMSSQAKEFRQNCQAQMQKQQQMKNQYVKRSQQLQIYQGDQDSQKRQSSE